MKRGLLHLSCVIIFAFGLSAGCKTSPTDGENLVKKFDELEALEQQVFDRLVFTMSPKTMKPSFNFKFIVHDQLDRPWIFKTMGLGEVSDGEVAVHRFYKLFGYETPVVFPKTFILNGRQITGVLQPFVSPSLGDLTDGFLRRLPPEGLANLGKAALLGWLVANHHVHRGQFLVLPDEQGRPKRPMRIDNSIEWFLIGHDRLSVDYATPVLWNNAQLGYARYWRMYVNKEFDLPIERAFDLAALVAEVPDGSYAKIFEAGIRNHLYFFANNALRPGTQSYQAYIPEIVPKVDETTFLEAILKRKNDFPNELRRFVGELRKVRDDIPDVKGKRNTKDAAARILKWMDERMKILRSDLAEIEAKPSGKQAPLESPASFPVYLALKPLMTVNNLGHEQRKKMYEGASKELNLLIQNPTHPNDQKSARIAMRNLQDIIARDETRVERGRSGTRWLRSRFMRMNDLIQEQE